MKKNEGITLIVLVLTIVIALILISVAGYSAVRTMKNAKVTKFVASMQTIQKKVDQLIETKQNDDNLGVEITKISDTGLRTKIETVIQATIDNNEIAIDEGKTIAEYIAECQYFDKNAIKNIFEVELDTDIVVNFKTREVISLTGIEYASQIWYTQYKLPNGQTIVIQPEKVNRTLQLVREVDLDDEHKMVVKVVREDGDITTSTSNCTIRYCVNDDKTWTTVTNYTSDDIGTTYEIPKIAVNYKIELIDNITKATLGTIDIKSGMSLEVNKADATNKSIKITATGNTESEIATVMYYSLSIGTDETNLERYGTNQSENSGESVFWNITNLTPGVTYYYEVKMTDKETEIESVGEITLENALPTGSTSYENLGITSVTINSTCTDTDGDNLTYTLRIEGTTYEAQTKDSGEKASWDVTALNRGTTYSYTITITDGYGTITQTGSLTTIANTPPTGSASYKNLSMASVTIDSTYTDADGDNLTYTLRIGGTTYETQTRASGETATWNVTALNRGTTYSYTITITDGYDTITQTGSFTTIANTPPTGSASYTNLGTTTVTINSTCTDTNGDNLTYTLRIGATTYETQTKASGTKATWNVTGLNGATTYSYTVTITDGYDTITKTGSFTTQTPNSAPVIKSNTCTSKTSSSITISAKATDADGDKLTYKLYTNTSTSGSYTLKDTVSSVTQNTTVTLDATGLYQNTRYYWYITVYDGIDTTTSGINNTYTEVENSAPVIVTNSLSSKTTTSFIIDAKATDANWDYLTYTFYTSTSQNGTYSVKETRSSVSQNTAITLSTTGLSEYTTYWWYITVYDGKATTTSDKQSVKTYCPGTGYTCSGNGGTCTICNGIGWITCTTCAGVGTYGVCPYKNTSPYCTGWNTQSINCPTCGNPNYIGYTGVYYYDSYCDVCNAHGPTKLCGQCTQCGAKFGSYDMVNDLYHNVPPCSVCGGDGKKDCYKYLACSHGYHTSHSYCTHGYTQQHD